MGSAYRVVTVDLSPTNDRFQIEDRDSLITSVSVLALTAGATFELHLGQKVGIPIDSKGVEIHELCEQDGLFVSNQPQAGATATLYIGYGSGQVTSEP